ncbi:DUF1573 domain-containing protein [Luteolibacter algae]|uniref:DUF1573 domain-containing protein n=1 Tax=Luteolibacter algae TaxID=454151 RepID=A0ABW5D2C1_9BACT
MKCFFTIWLALTTFLSAAGLKFESELIEVDAAVDASVVTSDFKFTNSGSEDIKIVNADAGCSCLSVQVAGGKLIYKPGESGVLRATFEVGSFQGEVNKPILIWLEGDSEEKPSAQVMLRVHVPVMINLEPKTLKWEVGDPAQPKSIEVTMDYEKPIKVLSVSTSNTDFESKLVVVEEGKSYKIEVTPKTTSSPSLTIVRIETDTDVKKQRVQQAFAVIRAPLKK